MVIPGWRRFLVLICVLIYSGGALGIIVNRGVQLKSVEYIKPVQVDRKRTILQGNVDTRVHDRRKSSTGHFLHQSNVNLFFTAFNKEYYVEMELFEDLIHPDYQEYYGNMVLGGAGTTYTVKSGLEMCYYRGMVQGDVDSWLALSTCNGELNGVIQTADGPLVIAPSEGGHKREDADGILHIIYREGDQVQLPHFTCGSHSTLHENEEGFVHNHEASDAHAFSRGLGDSVPNKFVSFFAVNDLERINSFGGVASTQTDTLNTVSLTAQRYLNTSFTNGNVIIQIIGQYFVIGEEIFLANETTPTSLNLLKAFCQWRTSLLGNGTEAINLNDNAHLLTGRQLATGGSDELFGLAWVGTMCDIDYSCGIDALSYGVNSIYAANVLAHELGHNFNSLHDGTDNTCPTTGYIMAPVSCDNCGTYATSFSSCSYQYINNFIPNPTCLVYESNIQYPGSSSLCGNYIVNPGEQCDVGPEGSACCYGQENDTSLSCHCKPGAVCDDTNPCCLDCQFRPTTYQCAAAFSPCDLDDYCNSGGQCPNNIMAAGTTCTDSGICNAFGICMSRDESCSLFNSDDVTDGAGTFTGPYKSCDSTNCYLACSGSSNICLNMTEFYSSTQALVPDGLGCTCGTQNGTCLNGDCICKTTPLIVGNQLTAQGIAIITGSVVGGVLLIALLAGILFCVIQAKKAQDLEAQGIQKFKAIYSYQPLTSAEIELRENDIILLFESYEDGWAIGKNERSKKQGAFPISYVKRITVSRLVLVERPATLHNRMSRALKSKSIALNQEKRPPRPMSTPPLPPANMKRPNEALPSAPAGGGSRRGDFQGVGNQAANPVNAISGTGTNTTATSSSPPRTPRIPRTPRTPRGWAPSAPPRTWSSSPWS